MSAALLALAFLLLPAAAASSGEAVPERFRVFSLPITATALIGKAVRSSDGERLGTLRELVFDLRNNRVHHAVLDVAGGVRHFPMHRLRLSSDREHVVLKPERATIEHGYDEVTLLPASALIGPFASEGGGGRLTDVVIDAFWGDAAFAAIALDGETSLRPVPLDAFLLRDGALVLATERGKVAALPGFTAAELDARILDRDFLQRNARNAHRLTPLQ